MLQYMKVQSYSNNFAAGYFGGEEFGTMFCKIPELHGLHQNFLDDLSLKLEAWDGKTTIGEQFKVMANNTELCGAFCIIILVPPIHCDDACSAHSIQF